MNLKDIDPQKPAYRVEVEHDGCMYCDRGKCWIVVGPDDTGSSTSYEDEEDAHALANALNAAYELGRSDA